MAKKSESLRSNEIEQSPKVVLVDYDDWQGLYIDGELVLQDHRLKLSEVLSALGIKLETKWADGEWLESRRSLTRLLKDVKFSDE